MMNTIPLKKGWNLIGTPIYSSRSYDVSEDEGGCVITRGPWRYISSLSVWQKTHLVGYTAGYFIKVENDCVLGGN